MERTHIKVLTPSEFFTKGLKRLNSLDDQKEDMPQLLENRIRPVLY